MLEGLEATEVRFVTLLTGVETFRLDSEYYRREYIEIENHIKSQSNLFCKFSDWGVAVDCSAFYAGIEPLYGSGNIPLIRVQNVKETIDYANCVTLPFLTEPEHSTLKMVEEGDIVITKGGSIGFVGYVTERAYASRDLIFLKTSGLAENHRIFLYLYLSSPFVFKQLIRSSSQCAQPHLTITLVKNFDILKAQEVLVEKCSQLYKKHREVLCLSKSLYTSAENYLLECLGMQGFVANPNAYNIKTLKESFLESGRIDAEYYLPKYDDLERLIESFECARLSDLCTLIDHGKQPPYVEGGEVRVFSQKWIGDKGIDYGFIDSTEEPMTSLSFATDNPEYVCRQNDIVYYSVGANIGYCHNYLSDVPMMPGSFITIIRADKSKINPLYLGFVLNSFIGRTQAEKRKSGTAQPYIYPKDLKEFIIPLIRPEVQAEIAQYIQRSFALRKEASQLLEEAKLSVEQTIAIGGGVNR